MAARLLSWLLVVGLCLTEGKAKSKKAPKGTAKDIGVGDDKGGWNTKINSEGKQVQELKIEAPSMTEEDQYGYVMPERYKCDSCRAVMFHLDDKLKKTHPKSRRMKQWEYNDRFDEACQGSFEGYGIKLLNGENTLSGPGLTHAEPLSPGAGAIQMGGETWTKRLTEACRKIVYERIGEDELYDKFREDGGLTESICFQDLGDCVTGPKPHAKPKEEPAAEKPKAEKAKAKKEKKPKVEKAKAKAKEPVKPAASTGPAARSGGEERVDSTTFLRRLAEKHGLTSDEYLTARTERDWEKLIVATAGRIFNRIADSDPSESCRAK